MGDYHEQLTPTKPHLNDKSSRKNSSTIFSLVSAAGGLAVVVFAFTGLKKLFFFIALSGFTSFDCLFASMFLKVSTQTTDAKSLSAKPATSPP